MEEIEKNDCDNFTHEALMEITTTALNELLAQDIFLCDLPRGVILEEVNNQIALLHGRSIKVYVLREDGEKMPVIVPQAEGTVADLKKSIKRVMSLKLKRFKRKRSRPKSISWKYVWRSYQLQFEKDVLTDSNKKLKEIGIKSKSCVSFVKKRRKVPPPEKHFLN